LESRIRAALLLYAFLVLGLFLLVAPWTVVWSRAFVGLGWYPVARFAQSGGLRGLVSALGALNLLFALQVALELGRSMRGGGR
jgi:hypothetical protein